MHPHHSIICIKHTPSHLLHTTVHTARSASSNPHSSVDHHVVSRAVQRRRLPQSFCAKLRIILAPLRKTAAHVQRLLPPLVRAHITCDQTPKQPLFPDTAAVQVHLLPQQVLGAPRLTVPAAKGAQPGQQGQPAGFLALLPPRGCHGMRMLLSHPAPTRATAKKKKNEKLVPHSFVSGHVFELA